MCTMCESLSSFLQDGNTPVSSLRDLSEPQVPNNQEAGAENPTSTSPDVPPALPAKKARRGNVSHANVVFINYLKLIYFHR